MQADLSIRLYIMQSFWGVGVKLKGDYKTGKVVVDEVFVFMI